MIMWQIARKWSLLLLTVSVILSLGNLQGEPKKDLASDFSVAKLFSSSKITFIDPSSTLEYDFYRDTCPQAEQIVRLMVRYFHTVRPNVGPALLRLLFHDCFIQGCDASVLLDAIDGVQAEKEVPPNETLKGFDLIDTIKSKTEEVCPATVSCADILVLAAREAVILAGGPFYPLYTGRRDSTVSFPEIAAYELPSPHNDLSNTLTSFASRGFTERETVCLLGAHSIGIIHCRFIHNRIYNFEGSGQPDPSLESGFLDQVRSKCNNSRTNFSTSDGPSIEMDYDGTGFSTHYYRSLVQGRGILHADQQLMTGEGTADWVQAYASDGSLFRRDFSQVMMKLSSLRVLTGPLGQVRLNCSKVV